MGWMDPSGLVVVEAESAATETVVGPVGACVVVTGLVTNSILFC